MSNGGASCFKNLKTRDKEYAVPSISGDARVMAGAPCLLIDSILVRGTELTGEFAMLEIEAIYEDGVLILQRLLSRAATSGRKLL